MYNFIDVNEASESVVLPSEALKINGEYIENLISGYRTLNVSGREALSPDVVTYTTGVHDGSFIKNKRYPERIIIVKYQLVAESNEAFRAAYNQLGKILDVENAELIFNDEQDKYFIGTPCIIGSVKPGTNAVTGEFEILCADPFKYSVMEYEAEADLDTNSILVDYKGTYKAYPTLVSEFYNEEEASEDGETVTELTGSGDCGYVAFFNESEKIIQIGNPDEVDGVTAYAKSQTLLNTKFNASTSWGTAAKSLFKVNSGITSSEAVEQAGSLAMKVASYETKPGSTAPASATILNILRKTTEVPYFKYVIKVKTSGRTTTSVKLTFTIEAQLLNSTNYFGKGYGLRAYLNVGGSNYIIKLKDPGNYWRGTTVHSYNVTAVVTGLTSSTSKISGITFKVVRVDSVSGGGDSGTVPLTNCASVKISSYSTTVPDTYYLAPSDFGTGDNWHGPSITRVLPADASGAVGATNFTLTYSQKMSIGSGNSATGQLGAFQVLCVSGSGDDRKVVAGVNVYKGSSGKKAKLRFYVNNTVMQTMDIDLSYNNQYFHSGKSSVIKKSGQTVTFNICGVTKTFRDANIASVAVNEVTFTMTKFGTKTPLEYNGLYWAKFVKDNCTTWKDVPNKFSTGDVVEADCRKGEIYLNGVLTPALGALGNDWEEFFLTPGLNQIGFSYSEWVAADYAPTIKMRYREVFL